jgi:hypothetical protein
MERYRGARRPVNFRVLLLSLRAIPSRGLQSIVVFSITGFSLCGFLEFIGTPPNLFEALKIQECKTHRLKPVLLEKQPCIHLK